MTASVVLDADAAPTWDGNWHGVSWSKCHSEVRKLQVRIAKATREGRWRKVKALQWLLTHSFSGKALAVKRVTENQGKKTPGVDGITWSTPEAKAKGIESLKRRGYQPKPLRRVYIPKSNGKLRPLGIPTMLDRAMQALHLLALEPVSETTADWNSYGFRPERATRDAIGQLFNVLAKKDSPKWVLEGDIKGCFDHISHEWMLQNICTDTETLRKWLKCGAIDNGTLFPTDEGTPQGGIISPTLANLVLDGLEDLLGHKYGSQKLGRNTRYQRGCKVNFVRYADDFVITGVSQELLENEIKPTVRNFLAERGLQLSEEKTRVTHISEGFDFLGQNVRKYRFGKPNEKLLIKPSKKNVKTFLDKVRDTIWSNKTAKQENLIGLLNPIIRGWSNYHRHVVAAETFEKVDNLIWHLLWRWAARRHPCKSHRWVSQRYFGKSGDRIKTFIARIVGNDGLEFDYCLVNCISTGIKRHAKITGEATPYDPAFEQYFEDRLSVKMDGDLKGRRKLRHLWLRQKGRCPVCGELITKLTKWNTHHLTRRVDGGSDSTLNLWLLHPNCHRQHHANPLLKWKLSVG